MTAPSPFAKSWQRLNVFAGLERLVERFLVRQDQGDDGEPRFPMSETIREYGPEASAAAGLEFLGLLALRLGDAAWVKPRLAEALRVVRNDDCPAATGRYRMSLATGLRAGGEIRLAAELLRESLQLARDAQDRTMTEELVASIAGIADESGWFHVALQHFGVAESHGAMRKSPDNPVANRLDDDRAIILAAIGPATETAVREERHALSLPAEISAALKISDEIALFGQAGADSIFDSTTTRNGENT